MLLFVFLTFLEKNHATVVDQLNNLQQQSTQKQNQLNDLTVKTRVFESLVAEKTEKVEELTKQNLKLEQTLADKNAIIDEINTHIWEYVYLLVLCLTCLACWCCAVLQFVTTNRCERNLEEKEGKIDELTGTILENEDKVTVQLKKLEQEREFLTEISFFFFVEDNCMAS